MTQPTAWAAVPFDQWMTAVDDALVRFLGLSSADLPDCPYALWHESGESPRRAATKAVRLANGEEVD